MKPAKLDDAGAAKVSVFRHAENFQAGILHLGPGRCLHIGMDNTFTEVSPVHLDSTPHLETACSHVPAAQLFYVISGTVAVSLGETRFRAKQGTMVHIPPRNRATITNTARQKHARLCHYTIREPVEE